MRCAGWSKSPSATDIADVRLIPIADLLNGTNRPSLTRQIASYVLDRDVRDRVRDRVLHALGPDTRVVVGHSLGSVAAYEALCALQHQVSVFITLGSPLGFRRAIFDRLTSHDWPGELGRWVNVADRKDPVAMRRRLRPLFGDGTQVEDLVVNNGPQPHAMRSYLKADAVRSVISQAMARRHMEDQGE
ncbi:alpha/beta fold hydrolase [Actinomadura gamaensis]|uniref:Alpha/beta fold hydrolase n=1 Tax=Actinomadura gamaensis TaxID=1763541 RepID=A0ABV9TSY3_9ACTN